MKIFITGVAGFIGSHLLEACLKRGDQVVGVDNFLTGKRENLNAVLDAHATGRANFLFTEGDIRDLPLMMSLSEGCDLIFHEAAIGSVPWSIEDPALAHATNLTGFVNVLECARRNKIRRVVYASSSAVFGNSPEPVAKERHEGEVLSPYAATKRAMEIYAESWAHSYGVTCIGLRYFNVFGPRQDPNGAYAAVIPRWRACMENGESCKIFGGGGASTRDYCHVSNVVHANLLAAAHDFSAPVARAYNVGCGQETTLDELFNLMSRFVSKKGIKVAPAEVLPPRPGDILRSCACIDRIRGELGFEPVCSLREGLRSLILE